MSDEYWKSVKVTGMPVPVDRSLEDSTVELVGMLDHPDPRLRDDLAVSVLTTWIGRGVYDELLHGLGDGLVAGLNHGLGRPEDPTVLRRTSSALLLAEVVNRDTVAQVLDPGTLLAWGDAAAGWLVREQDQRGWSADLGPIQTVANGADLLAALARSRHLGRLELTVLLDVVGDLLLSPTPHVWHHGEDDRVAHAVMTVIHRAVVDRAVVEAWIARLGAGTRPRHPRARLDPVAHPRRAQHLRHAAGAVPAAGAGRPRPRRPARRRGPVRPASARPRRPVAQPPRRDPGREPVALPHPRQHLTQRGDRRVTFVT